MTPAEKAGWRVGDLGTVVKDSGTFAVGSVVKLKWDDRSHYPLWELVTGQCYFPGNEAFLAVNSVHQVGQELPHDHDTAPDVEFTTEKEPSLDAIWEQIKRSCS